MGRSLPWLLVSLFAACQNWPGVGDGGAPNGGTVGVENTSGGLGSSCSSTVSCNAPFACDASRPNGFCTRGCQSDADCNGGTCDLTALTCAVLCTTDRSCRPEYTCQSNGTSSVCAPGSTIVTPDAGAD
jgi:hypothetical protein